MELFPDRLVTDLERLPGESHSWLKQVCSPEYADVRERLRSAIVRGGPIHADRAVDLLSSLDNRRFFQGFAEVSALAAARASGWELTGLSAPGPKLEMRSPSGQRWVLGVLAFLHQARPEGERSSAALLRAGLLRVQGKHRFSVLVRRWLPHDFDVDPVRRVTETWLAQVAAGRWEGRYAAYDDDRISLEFCLTGEKVRKGEPLLAQVLGPFLANRTLEAVEPRIVRELDRHNASSLRDTPVLLACVADQPWALSPGYARDFLYGRPRAMLGDNAGQTVTCFSPTGSVAVFRDPTYRNVGGLLLIDRQSDAPTRLRVRAWLNPWADQPLRPADIGFRCFGEDKALSAEVSASWAEPLQAMAWQGLHADLELG